MKWTLLALLVGLLGGVEGDFVHWGKAKPKLCPLDTLDPNWPIFGHDIYNTRFQPLSLINHFTAPHLGQVWNVTTGPDVDIQATPSIHGDILYVPSAPGTGRVFALNKFTGEVLWERTDIQSRSTPAIAGDKLIVGSATSGVLYALNRFTGETLWFTVLDPYRYAILTQSPTVYRGRIYIGTSSNEEAATFLDPSFVCCQFRGAFFSLDLETGSILWNTSMITAPGFFGAAIWGSSPSIFPKARLVYVATGNNYLLPPDVTACILALPPGTSTEPCNRPGNLVDAIVAMSLETGQIVWSFTSNGADYWTAGCQFGIPGTCTSPLGDDFDFGQAPMLWETSSRRALVGAGSKSGIFFALDALSGELVWETPVGPPGPFGGIMWGSAVNHRYVFTALTNSQLRPFSVLNNTYCTGGWAALHKDTGDLVWFTPAPPVLTLSQCVALTTPPPLDNYSNFPIAFGPISVTLDVAIGASFNGTLVVMDAHTGSVLQARYLGQNIAGGASIAGSHFFLGSGYDFIGSPGGRVYSFGLRG